MSKTLLSTVLVLYTLGTDTEYPGQQRPAVALRKWSDTCANLAVFTDGGNDVASGAPWETVVWKTSVSYDANGSPGTWMYQEDADALAAALAAQAGNVLGASPTDTATAQPASPALTPATVDAPADLGNAQAAPQPVSVPSDAGAGVALSTDTLPVSGDGSAAAPPVIESPADTSAGVAPSVPVANDTGPAPVPAPTDADVAAGPGAGDQLDAVTIETRLNALFASLNAIAIDGTGEITPDGHAVFSVRGQDGTEVARGTVLALETLAEAKAGK